ncbi:MAG: DUF6637 family protein [Lachnospiraceae bacterium]
MYVQEKRKNPRNSGLVLDLVHIVIGILIVVLAVITFLNPEDHMLMFPAIFLLASVLNVVKGAYKVKEYGRNKKKKISGLLTILTGLLLLALCVISAISIWG